MRVAVTGAAGLLATTLVPLWRRAGAEVIAWTRAELDVTDRRAVVLAVAETRPDALVHAAAWTDVDGAEAHPAEAWRVNVGGAEHVAEACAASGARLVMVSTDYVFDGAGRRPIEPGTVPAPLGAYGRSKAAGEAAVARAGARCLLLRTGWLYGPGGRNFVDAMAASARAGRAATVVDDQHGAPTSARLVAEAAWRLLGAGSGGPWHVAAAGATTWWAVARSVYRAAGADPELVRPCSSAALGRPAARPAYAVLDCALTERALGGPLPAWEPQLQSYVAGGVLPAGGLIPAAA